MQKNFTFKIASLPTTELTAYNAVFVNFTELSKLKQQTGAKDKFFAKIKGKIVEVRGAEDIQDGTIAMGKFFRQMLKYGSFDTVSLEYMYDHQPPKSNLTKARFAVQWKERMNTPITLNEEEMGAKIIEQFKGTPINSEHILFMNYEGYNYFLIAEEIEIDPLGPMNPDNKDFKYLVSNGFLALDTDIRLLAESQNLKLKTKVLRTNALMNNFDFNFEKLGIGGLDKEISDIFRRAFTTRLYPPEYLEKYGINHVKGMLLYGPPGTGKTLIARTLAQSLNVKEFKVVNGPELFDKYVGETEKKIRDLFVEAEKDQKENGDAAGLHVIAFDEIDSMCRARGTINSGTGVHDGAVNQLLTKIDGVESLNNIIVIGMTNRKDLIDEAILRPGRLELHIEISLPDEKGRLAILKIHTRKMAENKVMGDDVNLEEIAALTKNYTGADIESMVKLACSNALSSVTRFGEKIDLTVHQKVNMQHFKDAINEIQPMFGYNSDELENCLQFGMINYGPNYELLSDKINSLFTQIKNSSSISLISVLLEGASGCGKTALASFLALRSGFPYVKIISPESLVKYLEGGKYSSISTTFENAYKSPYSVIILDNIEKLIEYIKMGPRFSNLILQTILVYIKKLPPKKGKKLLIIGTTSMSSHLEELDIVSAFDKVIHIPNLTKEEIKLVLNSYNCEEEEKEKIANLVQNAPIKQLCFLIDRALQKNQQEQKLLYENFELEYKEYKSK